MNSKLNKLLKKSESAINLVTKTIRNLSAVNDEIDLAVEQIVIEEGRLASEKQGLFDTKDSNKKIINNFEGLLK